MLPLNAQRRPKRRFRSTTFKPAFAKGVDPIWSFLNEEETVEPARRAGPLKTAGIAVVKKFECPDALTGFCAMKE